MFAGRSEDGVRLTPKSRDSGDVIDSGADSGVPERKAEPRLLRGVASVSICWREQISRIERLLRDKWVKQRPESGPDCLDCAPRDIRGGEFKVWGECRTPLLLALLSPVVLAPLLDEGACASRLDPTKLSRRFSRTRFAFWIESRNVESPRHLAIAYEFEREAGRERGRKEKEGERGKERGREGRRGRERERAGERGRARERESV